MPVHKTSHLQVTGGFDFKAGKLSQLGHFSSVCLREVILAL